VTQLCLRSNVWKCTVFILNHSFGGRSLGLCPLYFLHFRARGGTRPRTTTPNHAECLCCRLYVLYKLPQLKFLDSSAFRDSDRIEAEQKGLYLGVVRGTDDDSLVMFADDVTWCIVLLHSVVSAVVFPALSEKTAVFYTCTVLMNGLVLSDQPVISLTLGQIAIK